MNTPIDYIRFAANQALLVPALIGLRPYTITLLSINWSGERPGIGTKTETQTILYNDGYVSPKFSQVSKKDIVLSNGLLKDQDVVIGPIVFPYDSDIGAGGTDPIVFSQQSSEFYINIKGPNFPSDGVNYKKIWDNSEKNVMYRVYLRSVSAKNV